VDYYTKRTNAPDTYIQKYSRKVFSFPEIADTYIQYEKSFHSVLVFQVLSKTSKTIHHIS